VGGRLLPGIRANQETQVKVVGEGAEITPSAVLEAARADVEEMEVPAEVAVVRVSRSR
jgi:hypothetical protein